MNQDTGVTKGAKGATSTLGNAVRYPSATAGQTLIHAR
jgi:hypothetical protein